MSEQPNGQQVERALWPAACKGQCCGDCAWWWVNSEHPESGQCRQSPASVVIIVQEGQRPAMNPNTGIVQNIMVRQNTIRPMFPPMSAQDPGCGQFSPVNRDKGI